MLKFRTARALAALGIGFVASLGCAGKQPVNSPDGGGGLWNPPDIPSDKAGIDVFSSPAGAAVVCTDPVDGHVIDQGATPIRFIVETGRSYHIAVSEDGYVPATKDVASGDLALGEATEVRVSLTPVAHGQCCTVMVATAVPGAEIWLDGRGTGVMTPGAIANVARGTHWVDARLAGFLSIRRTEDVEADATYEVALGRDLTGSWNPVEGTAGDVRTVTMNTDGPAVVAQGFVIPLTINGDTLQYRSDDGLTHGNGQVLEDGWALDFTYTDPEGSSNYHYQRQ